MVQLSRADKIRVFRILNDPESPSYRFARARREQARSSSNDSGGSGVPKAFDEVLAIQVEEAEAVFRAFETQ